MKAGTSLNIKLLICNLTEVSTYIFFSVTSYPCTIIQLQLGECPVFEVIWGLIWNRNSSLIILFVCPKSCLENLPWLKPNDNACLWLRLLYPNKEPWYHGLFFFYIQAVWPFLF